MLALFLRDMRLSFRAGGGALVGILFFLAVISVMPFGVGPDLNLLARIGPAMLWIGADGSLDLLLIGSDRHMLALTVLVKCIAHWASSVLPLVIASPMLGLFMNMDAAAIGATTLTLLVGTPAIAFVGAVGAALAVALPRGGLLVSVIVLPLTIPVLIFGVSASYGATVDNAPFVAPFLVLSALTLFFAVLGPLAASAALKNSAD
jgi:heme exporter protein B